MNAIYECPYPPLPAMSVEAAERYRNTIGEDWERLLTTRARSFAAFCLGKSLYRSFQPWRPLWSRALCEENTNYFKKALQNALDGGTFFDLLTTVGQPRDSIQHYLGNQGCELYSSYEDQLGRNEVTIRDGVEAEYLLMTTGYPGRFDQTELDTIREQALMAAKEIEKELSV